MTRALARHILVATETEARDLKQRLEGGEDFIALAQECSICQSAAVGGTLGEFAPGDMVPEFDAVVFGDLPIGSVSDPVKTEFGYHLIEVQERLN